MLRLFDDPYHAESLQELKNTFNRLDQDVNRAEYQGQAPLSLTGIFTNFPSDLSQSVDWPQIRLVAPHLYQNIDSHNWYEHGELRDWHERRRRGLVVASQEVEEWEDTHGLTPSYRKPRQKRKRSQETSNACSEALRE